MPWTRLNPAVVVDQLRVDHEPDTKAVAEQALTHLREELLSGRFIAVQDHVGHTFIGTPAEAAEHMLGRVQGEATNPIIDQ